jgi:hypothetical protein
MQMSKSDGKLLIAGRFAVFHLKSMTCSVASFCGGARKAARLVCLRRVSRNSPQTYPQVLWIAFVLHCYVSLLLAARGKATV